MVLLLGEYVVYFAVMVEVICVGYDLPEWHLIFSDTQHNQVKDDTYSSELLLICRIYDDSGTSYGNTVTSNI